jgi:hypothetical protein
MAGAKAGNFNELISPFLRKKILEAEQQFGAHSLEYRGLPDTTDAQHDRS